MGRQRRRRHADSLTYPKNADVVINVGNKFQHNGPAPIVPRGPKFIDMRIDFGSMGNVMLTEVPLVADVGYGLDDLIAAVEQLMTPALKQKAAERADEVQAVQRKRARRCARRSSNNPEWDDGPLIADRVTWEIAQFADPRRHHRARGRLGRDRTASTSIRSAGASCSTTTAPISAPASAPRPASSSRGRTSR